MTMTTLNRRIGVLEQSRPTILPFALQRWLGEPLTSEQHRLADIAVAAVDRFIGPPDLRRLDNDMLAWLAQRGSHHAS
jgi:hypothetical protein